MRVRIPIELVYDESRERRNGERESPPQLTQQSGPEAQPNNAGKTGSGNALLTAQLLSVP